MRPSHIFSFALAAIAASGCKDSDKGDDTVVPVRDGTLNVATFSYACTGPGDEQCNADSELAPTSKDSSFPLVAAGAQFLVGTARNAAVDAGASVLTASGAGTTFFATAPAADKTLVTAVKPGRGSLLALDGTTVVDLTNLDIGTFDHVKVLSASPQNDFKDGAITIGPGGFKAQANVQYTFKFRVVPVDATGATLAGALPITWTIADPSIVSFASGANDNIAVFKSGAAGSTNVHVTVGDKTADIGITVGS